MKKTHKFIVMAAAILPLVTGCGDDKLVMSTTENTRVTTEAEAADDIDYSTEEASEEEKAITLEQIFEANKGDALLSGSSGFGAELTFYESGEPIGTESYFIGFDADGNYLQACENSNGVYRILDRKESCWYVLDQSAVYTLIYPEEDIFEQLVDYYHNDTVYTRLEDESGVSENISSIYRRDGKLIVETVMTSDGVDGAAYTYVLDDNLRIEEYVCQDTHGNKLLTEKTELNKKYDAPSFLEELRSRDNGRTITIKYLDSNTEYSYYVTANYPVSFETFSGSIYSDEACQNQCTDISWEENLTDENGLYTDKTVYYKKN
ncbi:MAG: hypothetical protein NC240_10680 [Clostridium sp.]|nr:hypothetical protein [Clostridium sp.]